MTQQERQERSRRDIFQAAMEQFGSKDYEKVTMESICSGHGISKGMMYHYYSNKDELFLLCVEDTFCALKTHIERETQSLEGQSRFLHASGTTFCSGNIIFSITRNRNGYLKTPCFVRRST